MPSLRSLPLRPLANEISPHKSACVRASMDEARAAISPVKRRLRPNPPAQTAPPQMPASIRLMEPLTFGSDVGIPTSKP
jgi:hypothetical protein